MADFSILAFPMSLLLAAAFLVSIYLLSRSNRTHLSKMLSSGKTAAILLGALAVVLAIDGTWSLGIYHKVPFLALVLVLMASLGVTVIGTFKNRSLAFTLSHLGIFAVLLGGFFGTPDFEDSQIVVESGKANHFAFTKDGHTVPLPFDVTLVEFAIDYYADGVSPKQYTSTLDIDGKEFVTSVNHPCHHKGYAIYQSGYDTDAQTYSVLKVVRDPWIPVVYLGMALLVLSAILQMRKTWKSRATLPAILVLSVLFSFISIAKINLGTLMPALRSLWFVPHLIIYMLAYSILAISLVLSVVSFFKPKTYDLSYKLLQTTSCLLLVGMICGAVWAKAAWGDYWTWDSKENWAAATWLITLVGTHIPNRIKNKTAVVAAILLSFAAMQMTWYGVNYLPSSKTSMHTYNN